MSSPDTLGHDDFINSLHSLILVAVDGDLPALHELDHLLRDGSLVVIGEGVLAEESGVAEVGIEGAQDDSQDSDVEGGDFFGEDFG